MVVSINAFETLKYCFLCHSGLKSIHVPKRDKNGNAIMMDERKNLAVMDKHGRIIIEGQELDPSQDKRK
jgi:hypothetical protein